jgi:hypothetical protein
MESKHLQQRGYNVYCLEWNHGIDQKINVRRVDEYLKKLGEKTSYEMKCVHINYRRHHF